MSTKRVVALLTALAVLLCMSGAFAQGYTAGEYSATAPGFGGDVTVTITFSEDAMTDVKVVGDSETEGIGSNAIEQLPALILNAQSADVDAVSGATLTSTAVLQAARDCVAAAMGQTSDGALTAGTYTAVAKGFYGDFDVTVTTNDQAIQDITIAENAETPELGGKAMQLMVADMLATNTAMVDTVSGATLSSVALRNAVADALRQANAPAAMLTAPEKSAPQASEMTCDVLVIGAGAAGYAAAIEAADAGASVIMLEKQGVIGGSTVTSAGIVYAALSQDDVPTMVDYYMERAEGNADREQLTYYAENSMNTIQWLTDNGVEWMFTAPSGTAPEARANFSMNVTGASLINPLAQRAEEKGIELCLNTSATELLTDENGAVVGAKAHSDVADLTIHAGAVVLATGGFDASEEMKAQYTPVAVGDFPLSSKGNVGDGLNMGIAVGADTVFNNGSIGFVIVDGSLPMSGYSSVAMGAPVYVGPTGALLGLNVDYPISYAYIKNAGLTSCFGLYDAAGAENGEMAVAAGFGFKADTLADLAAAMGADADALQASATEASLATAPFYAVVVKPSTIGSMGGLKTNTSAEVLRADDTAIAGLYAAGEVANGGFYYHEYPCSGSSISLSFTYGRTAGANAAATALAK